MNLNLPDSVFSQIADRVVWTRPELAAAAKLHAAGDARGAVLQLVRHLRERKAPFLGYSVDYIEHLRRSATAADRARAREAFEAAFERDLLRPYHRNTFSFLGAETLFLGADVELLRRLAQQVSDQRERWTEGQWGITNSVAELIRMLWPLPECEDEVFVPLLGWLLVHIDVEWGQARRWNENMLSQSGHNWWIHTFSGFWMAGLFFPEFRGLGQFQSLAPAFIEREFPLLFAKDGWSLEGAPGYHEFAYNGLCEMTRLARHNGIVLSPAVDQAIMRTAEANWKMLTPDCGFAAIGDDVPARHSGGRGPATMLRRRAARLQLGEAKYLAEALSPGWEPLNGVLPDDGEDLLPAYQALEPRAPAFLDSCLPKSGYYVMRENWTPRADWLFIDAAPIGERISSHKHVNIFNLELFSHGRYILADNWYGSNGEDDQGLQMSRLWREGSSAHNVVTVDGQSQVPVVSEYLYGRSVVPSVDGWHSGADYSYFSGSHEGYRHLDEPVIASRRKVLWVRGGYYIVIDRFTVGTPATHEYKMHFHLSVPGELDAAGRLTTSGEGGNLLIAPIEGARGAAALGPNPYPLPNYDNPDLLTYTHSAAGHQLFATLLVPFVGANAPQLQARRIPVECDGRVVDPFEVTALQIELTAADGSVRRDVYVEQHMEWNLPWRAGGYQGDARIFHSACPSLGGQ